jgi:hypothetical protein
MPNLPIVQPAKDAMRPRQFSKLLYETMTPLENITADKAEAETQAANSQGLVIRNFKDSYLQEAGPSFYLLKSGRPCIASTGLCQPG